jgi:Fungal specific transcription factor domain
VDETHVTRVGLDSGGHVLRGAYETSQTRRINDITDIPRFDIADTSPQEGQPNNGHGLPSLQEVLPEITEYFANSNRLLPLFHEPTFMAMLRDWYSSPSRQDVTIWAAINVALALGKRQGCSDPTNPAGGDLGQYVRNAQSVLNLLVTRDEDLLGIQIHLGLAIIFQEAADPLPATVLIATAVRLSHTLKLNRRQDQVEMDRILALQRNRVFWILYILDRDISVRMRLPALQMEADIDVDLPAEIPDDALGMAFSLDGKVSVNFLRCRTQLAWVQGKLYDWLLSVQAGRLPSRKSDLYRQRLGQILARWQIAIPDEFKPHLLPQSVGSTVLRYFTILHFTHLHCLSIVNRGYSHIVQWLQALRSYSNLVSGVAPGNDDIDYFHPPLPLSWERLVERSRACMRLFTSTLQRDLLLVQ